VASQEGLSSMELVMEKHANVVICIVFEVMLKFLINYPFKLFLACALHPLTLQNHFALLLLCVSEEESVLELHEIVSGHLQVLAESTRCFEFTPTF
jgi:hypothetical protein